MFAISIQRVRQNTTVYLATDRSSDYPYITTNLREAKFFSTLTMAHGWATHYLNGDPAKSLRQEAAGLCKDHPEEELLVQVIQLEVHLTDSPGFTATVRWGD